MHDRIWNPPSSMALGQYRAYDCGLLAAERRMVRTFAEPRIIRM
jgi:hypothetical protein